MNVIAPLITDEDRNLVNRVRAFVETEVLPIINKYWERADFPYQLIPKFRDLGIICTAIQGYGASRLTCMQAGLVAMELSRGDGSINTFNAVHSGLAMGTIDLLGSDEHRWLPAMARLGKIGTFALTEPEHGSDSVALETSASLVGDHYVINGAKRWIGMGHIADFVIIWARDTTTDNKVKAFVIEKDDNGSYPEGYAAQVITDKIAKRAVQQADISLTNVHLPRGSKYSGQLQGLPGCLFSTEQDSLYSGMGGPWPCYGLLRSRREIHERACAVRQADCTTPTRAE